jgi:hypothetical protein
MMNRRRFVVGGVVGALSVRLPIALASTYDLIIEAVASLTLLWGAMLSSTWGLPAGRS